MVRFYPVPTNYDKTSNEHKVFSPYYACQTNQQDVQFRTQKFLGVPEYWLEMDTAIIITVMSVLLSGAD